MPKVPERKLSRGELYEKQQVKKPRDYAMRRRIFKLKKKVKDGDSK